MKKVCKQCGATPEWGKFADGIEKNSGLCVECWHKPFNITSVCRADLQQNFTAEEIGQLDNDDMENIADKMGDAYTGYGGFWESLQVATEDTLSLKGGD